MKDWELCGSDHNRVLFRWGDETELKAGLVIGDTLKEADACLIAAAPDLLAALRDLGQAIAWETYGECRGWADGLLPLTDAMQHARAAIAKATGMAPNA